MQAVLTATDCRLGFLPCLGEAAISEVVDKLVQHEVGTFLQLHHQPMRPLSVPLLSGCGALLWQGLVAPEAWSWPH